jgi:hypothetical protein
MLRSAVVRAFVAGLLALVVLQARPVSAAIVYMGPNEANKTLRQAFAAMKGGDTLIIRDGVYTGVENMLRYDSVYDGPQSWHLPPSGSSSQYTVVRAEHEGQVTFDGENVRPTFVVREFTADFQYVEFHGLKWIDSALYGTVDFNRNQSADSDPNRRGTISHIKFFRCGASSTGPKHVSAVWSISAGDHLLFEECYGWGSSRYVFLAQSYPDAINGASQIIFRRCVARHDDVDALEGYSGSFMNTGGFMSYAAPEIEFQNCIYIDADVSKWVNWSVGYGFSTRRHDQGSTQGYPSDIAWRGNIVLNFLGWDRGRSVNYPWAHMLHSQIQGHENHVENSVYWDVMGVMTWASGDPSDQAAPGTIRNITFKAADDPKWAGPYGLWDDKPTGSYGVMDSALYPNWTITNYLGIANQNDPMRAACDYGAVYTTSAMGSHPTYNSTVGPGRYDYAKTVTTAGVNGPNDHQVNNEYNPFTGYATQGSAMVGTGVPALKYIVRIEPGSNLYGTGGNGANRGATVLKRYGVSGSLWGDPGYNTLTDEDLWPFPYEAQIRADMRAYSPVGGPDGKRGFCADGQTLTNYIWGYLGNAVPPLGLVAIPGDGRVTLSWQRPADVALSTIAGFNIYRVDGGQPSLVGTVDGNATYTATVTGLDLSSPNTFAMTTADAQKGESGYSEPVAVTPAGEPASDGSNPATAPRTTPTIAWATPASMVEGTPLSAAQLNATANVPGTFVYTPAAGFVLPTGTQTLSAVFTPADPTLYTTTTAWMSLVVNAPARRTPTITWPAPAPIMEGTPIGTAQLSATADVQGTFVYTPAAGTVLPAGIQTLTAVFTPADPTLFASAAMSSTLADATFVATETPSVTHGPLVTALDETNTGPAGEAPIGTAVYSAATAWVRLVVMPRTIPTLTWPAPAPIVQGTALSGTQLNATSSAAGTFAYSPAAGAVLRTGTQTLSVTFTPTDRTRFRTATASVTLVVNAPPQTTPTIAWPAPAPIIQGKALSGTQLNATASVAGTFVYTPVAGAVLPIGTHTLSATFTPTDTTRSTTATASVSLVVNAPPQTTPTIRWPAPAAVTVGAALSGMQLNATASVAGTFVYLPPAGTVMSTAGSQTMSVTFTPADTTNYTTATTAIALQVNPAGGMFAGPLAGDGWSGTTRGKHFIYNGVAYPLRKGTVTFPDCTNYLVAPDGTLSRGALPSATCTPAGGPTVSVTATSSSSFAGPMSGGGWRGKVQHGELVYNGVSYPIVDGVVTFPDCTNYLVAFGGALFRGAPAAATCSPQ